MISAIPMAMKSKTLLSLSLIAALGPVLAACGLGYNKTPPKIKNKIDPGQPLDEDLYALPENKVKKIQTVCGSLREAMESLDRDRDFLKQGGVFTDDQIDAYIALKFEEIYKLEHTPHPMEFEMYYSS